jgi:hypothetical protein
VAHTSVDYFADIRAYGAEKSEIPHAEQCNEHI